LKVLVTFSLLTCDLLITQDTLKDSVHRSLTIIGFICQFHGHTFAAIDWDVEIDDKATEFDLSSTASLTWSNAGISCYRIFSNYLMKLDVSIKCKALEGFSRMFVASPRLMLKLEELGLIK
jgi:hypothetical protein